MGHLLAEAAALPPEVVEEIVKRTDGVPLFLEEVTKVVPETALTNTAGGAIAVLPSSIGGAPDLAGLVDGATRPACRGTPAFGALRPLPWAPAEVAYLIT